MRPDIEQSLLVEYEELFALKDRIRAVADEVRARLLAAGLTDRLEPEVYDQELELRAEEPGRLYIRLDTYHLEITGAPPALQTHILAAILLDVAGAFRLTTVEAGYSLVTQAGPGRPLRLANPAFSTQEPGGEPMLDRRFTMTWDWGSATTGYSLQVSSVEDRELYIGFKAREGYMTLPELQQGNWMAEQARRFDAAVSRLYRQFGWSR